MNETELQKLCVEYLTRSGWFAFIVNQPNRISRGKKGIPDLWAGKNGRSMWIECKLEKGKLSKEQIDFRDKCEEKGLEWHLARSLDDVMMIVARKEQGK